jgi:hypothetical protein
VGRPKSPLILGGVAGALAVGVMILSAAAAPVRARFEGDRLWLNARDAPAAQVFSAIAERTGAKFVVDKEIKPGSITIDIEGIEFDRAIHNLVNAIPEAAGHSVSYDRNDAGVSRPAVVMIFGGGKSAGPASSEDSSPEPAAAVYQAEPTPDLDERMQRMIDAGVPRERAEKVTNLSRELQRLKSTPVPGTYSPEDLAPESRQQLDGLVQRGVPMERGVQMLLLQEWHQQTMRELSQAFGAAKDEGAPEAPPAGEPAGPSP